MPRTAVTPFVVPLAGMLTIAAASSIRARLLAALETQRDIEVDCAGGIGFDISFVQLLIAARRQASLQGSALTLAHGCPAPLADILAEGGFADWITASPGDAP